MMGIDFHVDVAILFVLNRRLGTCCAQIAMRLYSGWGTSPTVSNMRRACFRENLAAYTPVQPPT